MNETDKLTFVVEEFHLKLLEKISVDTHGDLPIVDTKRLYGNSDLSNDLLNACVKITGYAIVEIEEDGFLVFDGEKVVARGNKSDDSFDVTLIKWYIQMATALEILVDNLTTGISLGAYEKKSYYGGHKWTKTSE